MFSFLVQYLLVWLAEVSHQLLPLPPCYQDLAVHSRLQLQQVYHMPEPTTVSSSISVLSRQINLTTRRRLLQHSVPSGAISGLQGGPV